MLYCLFARHSEFFTTIFPAISEYPATVGRSHSFTKSVFILSFSAGRLKCAFHLVLFKRGAKMTRIFWIYKPPYLFSTVKSPLNACSVPPISLLPEGFQAADQIE